MKTREEVLAYINAQTEDVKVPIYVVKESRFYKTKNDSWHYGRVELADLMTFLYPESKTFPSDIKLTK